MMRKSFQGTHLQEHGFVYARIANPDYYDQGRIRQTSRDAFRTQSNIYFFAEIGGEKRLPFLAKSSVLDI